MTYTVTFKNAISTRGREEHPCDTFEAAVKLANDYDAWPYNNTRVDITDDATGHVDRICPDRDHRFDFDNHANLLCVCGFRPTSSVEAAEHHAGVAARNG
jgi:hypothetical protein